MKRRPGSLPDFEPERDGNRYAWILRAAAEVRAERDSAHAIARAAQLASLRRDLAVIRRIEAELELIGATRRRRPDNSTLPVARNRRNGG